MKRHSLRSAKSIAQRLEDYWLSLRLSQLDILALHLPRDRPLIFSQSPCEILSMALGLYFKLNCIGMDETSFRGTERNVQSVTEFIGGGHLNEYLSFDAATYRSGLTTNSVKRNSSYISSIINLYIQ